MIVWDLNRSLGCSPLGTQAYPAPPSPGVYDAQRFGVGQRTEAVKPLNPQSVALPFMQPRPRLDYGQIRQEPAIPGLDWLFTPIPRL
jgi:hypothetical protein